MTIDEWRENKSLTRWWERVLATDEGKAFLEMLEDSHVRHIQRPVTTPTEASVEYGKTAGYDLCANNVRAAAVSTVQPADPGEPTYEPPEELAPPRRARKQL